jgi:glycosyltransferase involved in cell wall biosynthesis
VIGDKDKKTILSAIVPIRPSLLDAKNVGSWFSQPGAEEITFILILDNPTHEIEDLVSLFTIQFSKVEIIIVKGNFGNPGGARNVGLQFIKSENVMFWDSDDTPLIPQILGYISSKSSTRQSISIGGFRLRVDGNEDREFLPTKIIEVACNPGIWRVVMSRDLITTVEFEEYSMGEDQIFLTKVFLKAEFVELVPEVFYEYKYGLPGQLTSKINFKDLQAAISAISQILIEVGKGKKINFVVDIFLKQTISLFLNGGWFHKIAAILTYLKIFAHFPNLVFKETFSVVIEMRKKRFK